MTLQLEKEVRQHQDGTPTAMTFVVDEAEPVDVAVARASDLLEGKNRRGHALTLICRAWLEANPVRAEQAEPSSA